MVARCLTKFTDACDLCKAEAADAGIAEPAFILDCIRDDFAGDCGSRVHHCGRLIILTSV